MVRRAGYLQNPIAEAPPLLSVEGLTTRFPGAAVVEDLSFTVGAGEIVAMVGESGSGKSITALSIMRLVPPPGRICAGRVMFRGRDLCTMPGAALRDVRGSEIAMVFQDPMTSLNPVLTVGQQIGEAMRLHRQIPARDVPARIVALLKQVGIPAPERRVKSYPHEFSGGMRQRVMIAMALANNPALLIADEPTTALDVTVQAQIVALLRTLNSELGTAVLLITHNVALVARLCQRMVVMYAGRVVEEGTTLALFASPQHPYTWSLLRAVPGADGRRGTRLVAIAGQPPDPRERVAGCKFQPRCPFRIERCAVEEPPLVEVAPQQQARCWVLMRNTAEQAA
jgi:oligopeptide/dipeptide ABC transporter ATP-binding protein